MFSIIELTSPKPIRDTYGRTGLNISYALRDKANSFALYQ